MFCEKSVLITCSKYTGEYPCRSVISIKFLCSFIENTFCHGYSRVNWLHIFRTRFLKNTSGGCFYILQLSLKERTPTRVFSDECWEVLKTVFFLTPPGNYFCSTEKYFTNKIVKNPLRKMKKMETSCKKNNDTAKRNHYLHQVFISYPKKF